MEEVVEHTYCELLVNVRCISVSASTNLPESSNVDVILGDGRDRLALKHAKRQTSVLLPGRLSSRLPKAFSTTVNKGHINLRLLEDEAASTSPTDEGSHDPWTAADLARAECGHCAECDTNIIRPGAVRAWKDLPSENWAEMMDFWHCHKPDVPDVSGVNGASNDVQQKGYSAFNRLTAQTGTALVDASHILLSEVDCVNYDVAFQDQTSSSKDQEPALKFQSPSSSTKTPYIHCTHCHSILGYHDLNTTSIKLFKWSLALGIPHDPQLHRLNFERCISARLLSISEASSARRLLVQSDPLPLPLEKRTLSESEEPQPQAILLWIFTPDYWLTYSHQESGSDTPSSASSSSNTASTTPTRATKILYEPYLTSPDSNSDSAPADANLEILHLPAPAYMKLYRILRENAKHLPAATVVYREWYVSFLRRFEGRDLRGG